MALPEYAKVTLRYIRRVLKSLDQFANVVTGGAINETISARAARLRNKQVIVGCVLCRLLDFFQKGHCDHALVERQDAALVSFEEAVDAQAAAP